MRDADRGRRAGDQRRAAAGGHDAGAASAPRGTLPDFSRIAERTVPAVVNISSQQVVRRQVPSRPVLQRSSAAPTTSSARAAASRTASAPASSSAPTATSSPTITSSPAKRGAVTHRAARRHASRSPTSARCRRRSIGVDPATDLALLKIDAQQPADDAVGRFVEAEGRRVGAGDRQPVSAEPDGDARHRLGGRPHQPRRLDLRGLHPDRRGDQPGQLRRRAGQRARRAGRHQHGRSSARAAATRASASPSRATSRGASSTSCSSIGEVRRGSIGYVDSSCR